MIRRDAIIYALSLAAGGLVAGAMPAWAAKVALSPQETQLINAISAYNSSIQTMAGRFLQIDERGNRMEGTFYLVRPNKISFRYNPPSRQEIVSVGRGFYVINRREKTQYAYPQDKVPLREFLNTKINLLATNIVHVATSSTYITLTLQDNTIEGTVDIALVFDIASKDLVQWILTEPNGQTLTFSLYDVEKNIKIPKSYFYIDATYKSIDPTKPH